MSQKYIIFDLDNCLSNDAWRIPKIDWSQSDPGKRYADYHSFCELDTPGNVASYRSVCELHSAKPIFFTARPVIVRKQTMRWLMNHLFRYNDEPPILIMRNNDDHRSSVALKRSMLGMLVEYGVDRGDVVCAFDDRQDIVDMYRLEGVFAMLLKIHEDCAYTPPLSFNIAPEPAKPKIAADILLEMAETYRARNAVYGDNFKMVARLMEVLFPGGVPEGLVFQDQFHLFELILVKLSRYAISGLTHIDSVHDLSVYGAMCEAINHNQPKGKS